MRISLGVRARSAASLDAYALVAIEHSLSRLWVYDSGRCIDPFVAMMYLSRMYPSLEVGVAVTNTESRHVGVVANAVATISNLAGGRTCLGVGRGDSALRFIGKDPTGLLQFEDRVKELVRLLGGECVEFGGRKFALPEAPQVSVPVFVSVEGKRSAEIAGQFANGAIIPMAADLDTFEELTLRVREAAADAGRRVDDIEVCGWFHGGVGETRSLARDAVLPEVGRTLAARLLSRRSVAPGAGWDICERDLAMVRELSRSQERERDLGAAVIELSGESLLWKMTVAGTVEDCRRKVDALARVPGVTELAFNVYPVDGVGKYVESVLAPFAV